MINEQDVSDFLSACGQQRDESTSRLYLGLILEEVAETVEAEGYLNIAREMQRFASDIKSGLVPQRQPNLIDGFDGGLDTIWVTIGYMLARNYPIAEGWNDVARSNRSKIVGGKVLKNENGKVLKPETYSPPDLLAVLNNAGYFG